MRFQSGPGYCGPAAVVNALRCFGIRAKEAPVATHAGCTAKDGSTEHGLRQALERYGCAHGTIDEKRYAAAEDLLVAHLKTGPAILLVEGGEHWVCAIGTLGPRVICFDAQNYKWNKAENGVHVHETGAALRRYWDAFNGKRYAILVHPPTE